MNAWYENIKVDVHDIRTGFLVDSTQSHNQIVDVGLSWMANALMSTRDTRIYYMSWGVSSTPTSTGQLLLSSETGRKLVTSQVLTTIGAIQTITYIAPSEGTTDIRELGWWAGSSATATLGSGVMLSRYLYTRTKTQFESITVTRTDSFTTG
jgi:hypothetical protein